MSGVYGRYKKVRDGAWQLLISCNVRSLPLDVVSVAKTVDIKIIKNSDTHLLHVGESGLSILDNGVWYIVYDDTLSYEDIRFTIAHEMGHIFLGHPLRVGQYWQDNKDKHSPFEVDADDFALRILSPACILWGMNLHTADEIANVCKIPMEVARKRAERMKQLYNRNKFLTSPLEKELYDNFTDFLNH